MNDTKSKNRASFVLALLWGFVIHLFCSYKFLYVKNLYSNSVAICVFVTILYLILFLASFGILIIEPLESARKEVQKREKISNWWWVIYLSFWGLAGLAIVEYLILDLLSKPIRIPVYNNVFFFFLIKGIFLIPSYRSQKQHKEPGIPNILLLLFLEVIFAFIVLVVFWTAGQVVPEFGE